VRIARLAYGQALAAAGRVDPAIGELTASLADRREWLADKPDNAERQRALVVGLNSLAAVLHMAGRDVEACASYGESGSMLQRMAKAGTLTQLDRDSLLKLQGEGAAVSCKGDAPA
jgi:hypothetical protein